VTDAAATEILGHLRAISEGLSVADGQISSLIKRMDNLVAQFADVSGRVGRIDERLEKVEQHLERIEIRLN
jgi:ABC-type transporter Mla subunit MlaD